MITEPNPALVIWVAERVVRQHTEPVNEWRRTGRCGQCGDDGLCPMLDWATSQLG